MVSSKSSVRSSSASATASASAARRRVVRAMAGQGQQRLNVVPTVTTLGMVKARLAGATRGHALLKKKSDALTVQFRAILKRIVSAKDAMGDAMRAASLSLAEALYVAGAPLRHVVQQSVSPGPARLRVRAHQDNIAGVRLPRFQSYLADDGGSSTSLAGLAGGGQQVAACRAAHARALEVLVELASLQTTFLTLDAAIRTTNRRGRAQARRRFRRHCGEHAREWRQGRGYHLLILVVPWCPLPEPVEAPMIIIEIELAVGVPAAKQQSSVDTAQ